MKILCFTIIPEISRIQVAQLWQRPHKLGDFKQVGHFEAKF